MLNFHFYRITLSQNTNCPFRLKKQRLHDQLNDPSCKRCIKSRRRRTPLRRSEMLLFYFQAAAETASSLPKSFFTP